MIARQASLLFLSKIITQIFGFISLFFVARWLGPNVIGEIGFALGLVGLFFVFTDLGLSEAHRKRISEGKEPNICIGTYSALKFILVFISISAVLVYLFILDYFSLSNFSDYQINLIFLAIFIFVLNSLNQMLRTTLEAKKEFVKTIISDLSGKVVLMIFTLYVAIKSYDSQALLSAQVFSIFLSSVIFIYFIRIYSVAFPSKEFISDYVKFSLPLSLLVLLSQVVSFLDRYMIGTFSSSYDLGLYVSSFQLVAPIGLISGTLVTALFPALSERHSKKDYQYIRHTVHLSSNYLIFIIFPFLVFGLIFSEEIIMLILGSAFLKADIIFKILLISICIRSISSPHTVQLMATGHTNITAKVGGSMFISNIILNLIFVPEELFGYKMLGLGAQGAALATLIGVIVLSLMCRYYSYKLFNIQAKPKKVTSHFLALIISGLLLYFIKINFEFAFFMILVPVLILSYFSYLSVMYITKEIDSEELIFIRENINMYKMINYIKDSMKT